MLQPLPLSTKRAYALAVNLTIMLIGLSTDIFLPSLPDMSGFFSTTKSLIQLTVTFFSVGMAVGQLVAGPIADALSRKKLILTALGFQCVAIVSILMIHDLSILLAARLLQGLGVAFMAVPARSILNDIFDAHTAKKYFSTVAMVFAIGPIIAPFIGGYIQHYFGWQANFIILFAYIVGLLSFFVFMYRETHTDMKQISLSHFTKSYATVLTHLDFLRCALTASCMCLFTALFTLNGPFIIQTALGYSAITYGRMALLVGVGWFIGSLIQRFTVHHDLHRKALISMVFLFLLVGLLNVFAWKQIFTLYSISLTVFFMAIPAAFLFSAVVARALLLLPKLSGTVNACLFSSTWITVGVITVVAALQRANSLTPFAITCSVILALGFLCFYGMTYALKKKTSAA